MKVEIKLELGLANPYAEIHTNEVTDEISSAAELLQGIGRIITGIDERGRIMTLLPEEIFMARVEDGRTVLQTEKSHYTSRKRLYELLPELGGRFMQISKSAVINLSQMECVEPSLGGLLLLKLKNGSAEYISRKYLPAFKKYLGM